MKLNDKQIDDIARCLGNASQRLSGLLSEQRATPQNRSVITISLD